MSWQGSIPWETLTMNHSLTAYETSGLRTSCMRQKTALQLGGFPLGSPSKLMTRAPGFDIRHGHGSKPMGSHFGLGAPPILEPILVGIGMFTGGTIWVLTYGHISM